MKKDKLLRKQILITKAQEEHLQSESSKKAGDSACRVVRDLIDADIEKKNQTGK
jgi:hypothetical protein